MIVTAIAGPKAAHRPQVGIPVSIIIWSAADFVGAMLVGSLAVATAARRRFFRKTNLKGKMMKAKVLEIRDRLSFVAALAVEMTAGIKPLVDGKMTEDEFTSLQAHSARLYLLHRCGYPPAGPPMIMLTRLDGNARKATNDPYGWGDRTFSTAHIYIAEHWTELKDGDVVDVEFILGETSQPKRSEREQVEENR